MPAPNKTILEQSSTSNITPESTQGLLEKANIFVKTYGGHFTLAITPTAAECRYVHPEGIMCVVADSFAAPSDMVSDVLGRSQQMLNEILKADQAEFVKKGGTLQ